MRNGDAKLVTRCSAVLRLAEQLERSRDQAVDSLAVEVHDDCVELVLDAHEDVAVARWAALKQRELFEEAFGKRLEISVARPAGSAGPVVTSSRSETASTTSCSASSRPSSGSASQLTRIIPVATFSSPTTISPQMTSPSSQPIRSRSNQERCTRLALPPHGQLESWTSFALQTACMFLAEASRLATGQGYPQQP